MGFTIAYFAVLLASLILARVKIHIIAVCSLLFALFSHPDFFSSGTGSVIGFLENYWVFEDSVEIVMKDNVNKSASYPNVFQTISEAAQVPISEVLRQVLINPFTGWLGFLGFTLLAFLRWRVLIPLLPMLALGLLGFQTSRRFIMFLAPLIGVGLGFLLSLGLFWILEDLILHVFGVDPLMPYYPAMELGGIELGGIFQGVYSLTLAGLAIIVAFICWYFLKKTKYGKVLQSVIFDREVSVSMGINVTKVYLITFIIGGMLGALGGAYIAPTISVSPGFAIDVVVMSFAVVVIGGMGSVPGALIGSLIVGLVRAFAVHQAPILELFIIYAIMAIVLIIKPEGLFAPPKPRKI